MIDRVVVEGTDEVPEVDGLLKLVELLDARVRIAKDTDLVIEPLGRDLLGRAEQIVPDRRRAAMDERVERLPGFVDGLLVRLSDIQKPIHWKLELARGNPVIREEPVILLLGPFHDRNRLRAREDEGKAARCPQFEGSAADADKRDRGRRLLPGL